jgi:hypothetical protein
VDNLNDQSRLENKTVQVRVVTPTSDIRRDGLIDEAAVDFGGTATFHIAASVSVSGTTK